MVIKLPDSDLSTLAGRIPIHLRAELYQHPAAPIIRLVTIIHDRPTNPLALETFINVADEEQRRDFEVLSRQLELYLIFYDETLTHRLTKAVGGLNRRQLRLVLRKAQAWCDRIAPSEYDFDRAKEDVMRSSTL